MRYRIPAASVNLVALETSTEYCSLAVSRGEQVYGRSFHAGQRHSELALPVLRELLQQGKLEKYRNARGNALRTGYTSRDNGSSPFPPALRKEP